MAKTIYKHTFTLTILSENKDKVPRLDLDVLTYRINEGEDIGQCEHVGTAEVPPEALQEELQALGNDGAFFDDGDAAEEAEEDTDA